MNINYDIWLSYSIKHSWIQQSCIVKSTRLMIFYNDVLTSLLARPWFVAICLRLLTLSAGDEHTSGHQQNLRLSIRVFMTRGVPLSSEGVRVWQLICQLKGLVNLPLATWPA
jgi:hypothetical protein